MTLWSVHLLWWRAEQKHNAALLASAEARASFASERMAWMSRHAHDVIVLLDEDGRIIDCNDRAEEVYGYSREELLQMTVFQLRDRSLNSTDREHGFGLLRYDGSQKPSYSMVRTLMQQYRG